MSEYRDDLQDTAVATDSVFIRLYSVVDDRAVASDQVFSTIGFLVSDSAVASDQVQEKTVTLIADVAVANDECLQTLHAVTLLMDGAVAGDQVVGILRTLIEDTAIASDEVVGTTLTLITDSATASDEVISQRTVVQLVSDVAVASDRAFVIFSDLVTDSATAADEVLGRARVVSLVEDIAIASDLVLGQVKPAVYVVVDTAIASDEVFDHLHAVQLVEDWANADDEVLTPGVILGQAWTAHLSNMAMSRWAPFGVNGLAVIDGVLYATTLDGVYALDGGEEQIVAEVRTGLIDMTGQNLGLPVESHIEYQLGGTATMGVTQTQSGRPVTYTYPLKGRPVADALTNARFEFGRGLLGRHFAYTLRMTGSSAYINDWKVLALVSKRSI